MKQFAKAFIDRFAPGFSNSRFLEKMTPRETELRMLAVLAPAGRRAIDVGANRGLYVHHLSKISRDIVAFEPLPPMQAWLRRNYPWLDLRAFALSDHEGSLTIRYPRGNYSWATLAPTNALEQADVDIVETVVAVRTLDSFALDNVGFIKIDVEGHEEEVLAGATETLGSLPNLLVESEERHNPGSPARLFSTLTDLGYAGFFVADGAICPVEEYDPGRDQPIANVGISGKQGRYINNFIFVPARALESYRAAIMPLIA